MSKIGAVTPDTISPEWITRALQESGADATVTEIERSRVGTGQVGETYRFRLTYEQGTSFEVPKTVVAKFSSRDKSEFKNVYDGEYSFFRKYASSIGMRVPRTYAVELNYENDDFVLLMEDQAPALQGDQMRGCTVNEARTAVVEAAKLHAAYWLDPELDEVGWLSGSKRATPLLTPDHFRFFWKEFHKRYGEQLNPRAAELADKLMANFEAWSDQAGNGPRCLVHGDFRPDNMLFREIDGKLTMTTVDWQTVGVGLGASDIAYFIGGGMPSDLRRETEDVLLQAYLDQLHEEGVTGYSMNDLQRDYSDHAFACAVMAIYASILVRRTERGDDMFLNMFHRSCDLAADRDTLAFLR